MSAAAVLAALLATAVSVATAVSAATAVLTTTLPLLLLFILLFDAAAAFFRVHPAGIAAFDLLFNTSYRSEKPLIPSVLSAWLVAPDPVRDMPWISAQWHSGVSALPR